MTIRVRVHRKDRTGEHYFYWYEDEVEIVAVRGVKYPDDARYLCEGQMTSGEWVRVFKKDNPGVPLPIFGGSHRNEYKWFRPGRNATRIITETIQL